MKFNNPIPVNVKCVQIRPGNIAVIDNGNNMCEIEIDRWVIVGHNVIAGEAIGIHRNKFTVSTRSNATTNKTPDFWILDLPEDRLEFLERKPSIGRLS